MNIHLVNLSVFMAIIISAALQSVQAKPLSWDQRMLAEPTEHLLLAEAKGRVTIYDGVYERDIDTAMSSQFDRIQNMMFVRTHHVTEKGEEDTDDDCD